MRRAASGDSSAIVCGNAPLELPDDAQIDQGARDVMLQTELGPRRRAEFQQHIGEPGTVRARFVRLLLGPLELVENDLLDALQTRGGVEFLVDNLSGPFAGDDFRGGDRERADALGDRRLGDTEVARGVGLGVAGVEVAVEGVGVKRHQSTGTRRVSSSNQDRKSLPLMLDSLAISH